MKQLHLLGSAAVVGLTVMAGTPVLAHGGHSGGHHSGGHHSSSHHSGGHHHGTAHHSAPHHSASHHHSQAHVAGTHHGSSHSSTHHSFTHHSFAHHGYHHWGHHSWNHGNWNYGGSWYGGPWGVWDGSVASDTAEPWYYESFFNVEPEAAVLPENGPIVSRGYRNAVPRPTSPLCRPSAAGPEEPVVAGSDGN
jgi:hypothetical protein